MGGREGAVVGHVLAGSELQHLHQAQGHAPLEQEALVQLSAAATAAILTPADGSRTLRLLLTQQSKVVWYVLITISLVFEFYPLEKNKDFIRQKKIIPVWSLLQFYDHMKCWCHILAHGLNLSRSDIVFGPVGRTKIRIGPPVLHST